MVLLKRNENSIGRMGHNEQSAETAWYIAVIDALINFILTSK